MEDLKCKKGNKNKDPLIKQRRKVKKKTRKKSKGNGKFEGATNSLEQLFSQINKPGVRKGLGRLRVKGRQSLEGMFFKGLRSEYITRDALNEARKNEDINKIIDIGRGFLQKGEPRGRCTNRITVCADNRKPKKSTVDLREVSSDGIENFEQCSLSPISSFAFTHEEDQIEDGKMFKTKLDLEKEFEKFSLKYEEAVGARVLPRLPQQGILEDALTALRKTRERERNDERFMEQETQFLDELKFVAEDFQPELPEGKDFIDTFAFPKKFPTPETHYYHTFNEKPLENLLIMTDVKAGDDYHPSFTTAFDNEEDEEHAKGYWFEKGFKTSVKDLIITPPIQFYRRNMF